MNRIYENTNFPNLETRQNYFSPGKRESEKGIVMLDSVDLLVGGLRFSLFFLRGETV